MIDLDNPPPEARPYVELYERTKKQLEELRKEYINQLPRYEWVRELYSLQERLVVMTDARDEALRLLEGAVNELAEYESDPSMLDGHRMRIEELRRVGNT